MSEATAGSAGALRMERRLEATPERVFRALTEPEAMTRWFAPGDAVVELAEVDLRVGGIFRVHMRGADGTLYRLRCEYREIDRPSRLVFTWRWEHEAGSPETLVTIELTGSSGQTLVYLTHSGFSSEGERDGHAAGWTSGLDKLAGVV